MSAGRVRIAVPDLISNSYFPAITAVERGCFAGRGYEAEIELVFPVTAAMEAMRDGAVDLVAGAAHAVLTVFPRWRGAQLLAALARHMYWFLVVRSDLEVARGEVDAVRGLRIGAAPGVDLGLIQLLRDSGVDPDRDGVDIAPVPGSDRSSVSFGVNAARALREGAIDGFWANGMGAEVAVRDGIGTVVLDVRRGDGPPAARGYTFAALVATEETIEGRPELVASAVHALGDAHRALRNDADAAAAVGRRVFPSREAGMIAGLIARDVPYYDATISPAMVTGLNAFARAVGLPAGEATYDDVVAREPRSLWTDESATPESRR